MIAEVAAIMPALKASYAQVVIRPSMNIKATADSSSATCSADKRGRITMLPL